MGRIPPYRHAFHLRYARALAGGTHNCGSVAARIYRPQSFNPSRKGLPARCSRRGLTDRRGCRVSSKSSTLLSYKGQRIAVIPTCADLQRFKRSDKPPSERVYGCVGTVLSGWFLMDWLAALFNTVAQKDPEARFEVVTRDDAETVRAALDIRRQARRSAFDLSERIRERARGAAKAVYVRDVFHVRDKSSLGVRRPAWGSIGCGVPVVANEGVGDVADIIRRYNVGVIVKDGSEAAMTTALDELEALRSDPDLPSRCRQGGRGGISPSRPGRRRIARFMRTSLDTQMSPEAAPAAANAANVR